MGKTTIWQPQLGSVCGCFSGDQLVSIPLSKDKSSDPAVSLDAEGKRHVEHPTAVDAWDESKITESIMASGIDATEAISRLLLQLCEMIYEGNVPLDSLLLSLGYLTKLLSNNVATITPLYSEICHFFHVLTILLNSLSDTTRLIPLLECLTNNNPKTNTEMACTIPNQNYIDYTFFEAFSNKN